MLCVYFSPLFCFVFLVCFFVFVFVFSLPGAFGCLGGRVPRMPGERPARPATLLLRGIRFCDSPHGGGKWPSRENHWEPLWGVFI